MMAVLSGGQIARFVEAGKLRIEPFSIDQIQPATYDLRLGKKILSSPLGPEKRGRIVVLNEEKPSFQIQPGQMVGILSRERLEFPLDLCGRFGIRSSFARFGINAFGGLQLDPGFRGVLTMNLLNVGPEPVGVTFNDLIFSIEFQRLDEAAEVGYSGAYQDQDDFPPDQYEYILTAHTTSLAEIPTLRMEISRLSGVIEELEENLPDPDEGLELRPEIRDRLKQSSDLPHSSLVSTDEIRRKLRPRS